METKESATRKAKALCKTLGKGWKIQVWENLGWHYSAKYNNHVVMHASNYGKVTSYFVMISIDGKYGGDECHWHNSKDYHINPKKALELKLKRVKNFINHCTDVLNDLYENKLPKS